MLNPVRPVCREAAANDDSETLPPIDECSDHDALTVAHAAMLAVHTVLEDLRAHANNWAVAERLADINAMLDEETRGLVSLSERCAEQEEAEQRDWFANAMATYHDSNR